MADVIKAGGMGATSVKGLGIWHGFPESGPDTGCGDGIELVLLESGTATLQVGRTTIALHRCELVVFWALAPHRVTSSTSNSRIFKLSLPVQEFMEWHLPEAFTKRLLSGGVVSERNKDAGELDARLFRKWLDDFGDDSEEPREILLLEIQARLRRLARSSRECLTDVSLTSTYDSAQTEHSLAMARFIAENYCEPLHNSDIARAAHLNTQYALRLFSRTFGVSIHRYVNEYRIAHACRLLATTNRKIIDVAMDSGFRSVSRFYDRFAHSCGQPPHDYRAAHRLDFPSVSGRDQRIALRFLSLLLFFDQFA